MNLQTSNEKRILDYRDIKNTRIEVRLTKNTETKKDPIKAFVKITFFGLLVIKGYRVWYSSANGLYATPPATFQKFKFTETVYIEHKILWKKLEEKIIEHYQNAVLSENPPDI